VKKTELTPEQREKLAASQLMSIPGFKKISPEYLQAGIYILSSANPSEEAITAAAQAIKANSSKENSALIDRALADALSQLVSS
jgi:hypothetical protein